MAYEARTQAYTIQLRHCGPTRSTYLRWQSANGNWEGWLFDGEADSKLSLDSSSSYSPADSSAEVAIARAGKDVVTLRAGNLTAAQHKALSTIITAPVVFIQELNGTRTPVLVAENATAARATSDGRHVLSIDILPPPPNSLTN